MGNSIFEGKQIKTSSISLKSRLIILLLVMILPFILFSVLKAMNINKNLESEAQQESLRTAREVARDLDEYINSTGEVLIALANNENLKKQNWPAVKAMLKEVKANYPFYVNIIFVDNQGFVRAMALAQGNKRAKPVNASDTAHYKRAMKATGLAVGDFMYSKLTSQPVVHVTYPVKDYSGKRIGYIAAAFDLTKLQNRLVDNTTNKHFEIGVIDNKGTVVARSKQPKQWVGKSIANSEVYQTMLKQGNEGFGKLKNPDDEVRVFAFAKTKQVPWYVKAGVSVDYIQSQVRNELFNHFAIFIPLLLVALIGWLWIGRDVDKLHQQTEYLTLVDPLTGLWNNRKLEQDFSQEIEVAKRYKTPLSFAMIDIDHFKHYNDHNGHQMGDEALKTVADIIMNNIRDCDYAYRYGGEELCILMPSTDKDGAAVMVERIRAIIEKVNFEGEVNQPNGVLTVSIGVATYPNDSISKDELIKRADKALYKAKELGRNKIVTYSDKLDQGQDLIA